MSETADRLAVLEALWPPGQPEGEVYAVLDGARDERIEMLPGLLGFEFVNLYGDEVGAELRSVAPVLVRLERGGVTEKLLELAWGNAWGIFAVTPGGTGMARMARHFRRLLRVMDEAGEVLLFRFYDPRVLRSFLPTCDEAQRDEVFGPVRRFVIEAPGGGISEALPGVG